jgi:TrpR family transcriptional regulator, trp operon repressor
MPVPRQHLQDLCALLRAPKDEREMQKLLSDLLSPKEIAVFAERWQLVKMLAEGVPQRTIAKKLKISISKVTRGSHALRRSRGGFRRFLKKKKKALRK